MSKQIEIIEVIKKIKKAFSSDVYPNYINYIRFPFFKNLKENSTITFNFPFTVLTGLNGSGKSSALHAIYGAPEGYSTGNYWFSTDIDPIVSEKGSPPAFIYGYKDISGNKLEVLKTRIGSSKGADYWETSRPIKKYGMKQIAGGKRSPAIKKKVVYLDFRAELSAFDKYFFFSKFKGTKTLKTKQDVLRKYSWRVKDALDRNARAYAWSRNSDTPISLDKKNIDDICEILGKTYTECKIIFHNLYGTDGATVYFKTNNLKYSEAFAGRGEFAVVKLVYEINRAETGSLIILDEPEASLHPGAQVQLKLFLLRKSLQKQLQIVISTHSPKLVEYLPDNAIKLFHIDEDGKFVIKNECSYFEAFHNIGSSIDEADKFLIIVEDVTAKMVIEAILNDKGGDYPLLFSVEYYPGGAEYIYKKAVAYSEENEKHKFILLDGDKKKIKFNPDIFTNVESNDFDFIKRKLKEETSIDFQNLNFRIDGGSTGGNLEQKKKSSLNYLKFLLGNLFYLPENIPEAIIWDKSLAINLLNTLGNTLPKFDTDYKKNFSKFTQKFYGNMDKNSILHAQQLFINNFVKSKNQNYNEILNIIDEIKFKIKN